MHALAERLRKAELAKEGAEAHVGVSDMGLLNSMSVLGDARKKLVTATEAYDAIEWERRQLAMRQIIPEDIRAEFPSDSLVIRAMLGIDPAAATLLDQETASMLFHFE